jgi:acyl carrier protein
MGRLYLKLDQIVPLSELPLTPSGKIDRHALSAPLPTEGADYVPPRTPMEEVVAAVWCELLQVPRVGAHDNFFDLGGHSLQGGRLMAHLRDELGVELPVRALFEAQTLAAFAEVVLAKMVAQVGEEAVAEIFQAEEG